MNFKQMFDKIYTGFTIGMGMYGFSRGYRADIIYEHKKQRLMTEKILNGTINGLVYATPFFNLYPLYKLLNRIELKQRNLNPNEYRLNYEEMWFGTCKDTF